MESEQLELAAPIRDVLNMLGHAADIVEFNLLQKQQRRGHKRLRPASMLDLEH